MTRRKRVWFRAHDGGIKAQGVAGETWCTGRTIHVEDLPELGQNSSRADIEVYAAKTYLDARSLKLKCKTTKSLHARSLCGIMVEVSGIPWGVIVIDSSRPKLATREEITLFYAKNAKILSKLLAVI